mmetsp:Transcript_48257/g.109402  ORF Transcript_48257/g.109402 Transcript_48257/m.109402 type:complete len:261 (+) Transcript_48257:350-1132(+)
MTALQVDMCSFGSLARQRCTTFHQVEVLEIEIRKENRTDALSESDRQAEWHAIQKSACLLGAVRDETNVTEAAAEACATNRSYPWVFNYHEETVSQQRHDDFPPCGDSPIYQFSGLTYSATASADYHQVWYNLSVGDAAVAPYEFCEGPAPLVGPGAETEVSAGLKRMFNYTFEAVASRSEFEIPSEFVGKEVEVSTVDLTTGDTVLEEPCYNDDHSGLQSQCSVVVGEDSKIVVRPYTYTSAPSFSGQVRITVVSSPTS